MGVLGGRLGCLVGTKERRKREVAAQIPLRAQWWNEMVTEGGAKHVLNSLTFQNAFLCFKTLINEHNKTTRIIGQPS